MAEKPMDAGRLVRAGSSIDILLERDDLKNSIRVLKAMIYEVEGNRIVISQTSPPLTKSHIGNTVSATYLVRSEGKATRYGFSARIAEFVRDYEMTSGERVTVPVLQVQGAPEPMNIRLHFRVRPRSDSGISLSCGGKKVNLLDISLGGVGFSHGDIKSFKAGESVRLQLNVDEKRFHLEARVVRVWLSEPSPGSPYLQFVTAKFLTLERDLEHALGRKIMMIQRQMLADGILKT
ncbi:MAG: Flagellar brake protein YcgR [Syntrophaceae bacterium PtaU1.Bin231]|nr:MAG: Flagellar brake protein YcgR [Syntrophaceae bacterium PtaU1.Bin231]